MKRFTCKHYENLKTETIMPSLSKSGAFFAPPNKEQFYDMVKLTQNNKEFFLKKYGRQTFVYTSEYKHWVWRVPFQDSVIWVFSGNKGTSYEVEPGYTKEDTRDFFRMLAAEISPNRKAVEL